MNKDTNLRDHVAQHSQFANMDTEACRGKWFSTSSKLNSTAWEERGKEFGAYSMSPREAWETWLHSAGAFQSSEVLQSASTSYPVGPLAYRPHPWGSSGTPQPSQLHAHIAAGP